MTNYRDRVQGRVQEILGPDEHVMGAVPVMDKRLAVTAMVAAVAGGASGRPWLGAIAVLVAFTVLRRRDRATGLPMRASMVLAVTEYRVIALRATVWNAPREVLWTVADPDRAVATRISGWSTSSVSVQTEMGSVSFSVPWIQRGRAASLGVAAQRR